MSRSSPATLTEALLEQRRAGEAPVGWRGSRGRRGRARPDHVVVADGDAALSFRLFESLGRSRFGGDSVLACATSVQPTIEGLEEQGYVERMARERGAWLSRAGTGLAHRVYGARIAAPGRIAVGIDPRLAAAGALGTLALRATPLEVAAALGGAEVAIPETRAVLVRLYGTPPAWMTGEDLAIALGRLLAADPPAGRVVELLPLESGALSIAARFAVARACPSFGAATALFPSDDTLRRFLVLQGRESDWRPLAFPEEGASRGHTLDYSELEPLMVRPDGEVLPVRERGGSPVEAVRVGPEATHADLARLGRILELRGRDPKVEVTIAFGSRQVRELAIRSGAMAALGRAGVTVDAGAHPPRAARGSSGLAVSCCDAATPPGWFHAGLESCAAAIASGAIGDPRLLDLPPEPEVDEVWCPQAIVRPTPPSVEPAESNGRREGGIVGPLRGAVLLKLGDAVSCERILPWGARVRPSRLDVVALAGFAFAGLDAGFAARAAAHRGGWVVAGREFGVGPWREQVGWVIAHLELRAILARSFAPELRRRLVQHGVLALQFVTAGDYGDIQPGDELELPDLPDGLEAGKPLVLRNLTRGTPYALRHDLTPEEIEQVRAGGLLASVADGKR